MPLEYRKEKKLCANRDLEGRSGALKQWLASDKSKYIQGESWLNEMLDVPLASSSDKSL
jgi:hypothetical protein